MFFPFTHNSPFTQLNNGFQLLEQRQKAAQEERLREIAEKKEKALVEELREQIEAHKMEISKMKDELVQKLKEKDMKFEELMHKRMEEERRLLKEGFTEEARKLRRENEEMRVSHDAAKENMTGQMVQHEQRIFTRVGKVVDDAIDIVSDAGKAAIDKIVSVFKFW